MRLSVGTAISLALASLVGCSEENRTITNVENLPLSIQVEHSVGPALSAEEDKVYILDDSGNRDLIFEGYGGRRPQFYMFKDSIIMSYCGGSILTTKSSFFSEDESARKILRFQPVIVPGLSLDGKDICPR